MKVLMSFLVSLVMICCLSQALPAQNQTVNKTLQLQVAPTTLSITTASLPSGQVGVAYTSTTLAAAGGVTPYTWSVCTVAPCSTTQLPAGMTLSTAGVLSGTPTVACKCQITFQVVDNSGSVAQIKVNWGPPASGPAVTAYNVKRGIAPGAEVQLTQVPASVLTFTDAVPKVSGTSYYYVATALNGPLESKPSNEAQALIQ